MVAPKSTSGATKAPGKVVSKGTLVVCKVSLVGQWVEVGVFSSGLSLSMLVVGVVGGVVVVVYVVIFVFFTNKLPWYGWTAVPFIAFY